ncbi:hypothetical protein ACFWU5_17165 [Nocardia sp. NPDC058640]|uniref:hypothetical protein n=1 Tax=Nocardia sp. NPDC058640 TaxID=3346571 RepID=UPI003669B821
MLAVAVTIVSGCSATIPGTAGPNTAPSPVTAFGIPVTAADKGTFDMLDQVRSVDPCGFVDRERFAASGVISALGPSTQIDECAVRFTPNGERNPSLIYIDLDHNPPQSAEPTRQIAGETVVATGPNSYGNCAFKVPLRFPATTPGAGQPDVVEIPTLAYGAVSSSGFESSELGCSLAEEVVAEIVEAFRSDKIPRRSAAATPVSDIELMRHNPCEIVAVLPLQVRLTLLNAEFDPTRCSFMVAGQRDRAEAVSVTLDLTRRPLQPFGAANHLIDVEGVPVLIYRDETIPPPTCVETFATGRELDPSIGGEDISGARVQPTVRISGLCSITEQLRPVAMKLFGATA